MTNGALTLDSKKLSVTRRIDSPTKATHGEGITVSHAPLCADVVNSSIGRGFTHVHDLHWLVANQLQHGTFLYHFTFW